MMRMGVSIRHFRIGTTPGFQPECFDHRAYGVMSRDNLLQSCYKEAMKLGRTAVGAVVLFAAVTAIAYRQSRLVPRPDGPQPVRHEERLRSPASAQPIPAQAREARKALCGTVRQ